MNCCNHPPTSQDPTLKVVTEVLTDLKKKKGIDKTLFYRLKLTLSRAPRFYGLPKTHKADNPLRPIVSAIGSPTYSLAKFITSIISPLMDNTPSFVKNSRHFSEMVSSESITDDEVMVSFDVQ